MTFKLLSLGLILAAAQAAPPDPITLRAARVLDGTGKVINNGVVEIRGSKITAIDTRLPQLTSRFNHDFAKDGLPEQYFRLPSGKPVPEETPNGVIHTEVSHDDTWAYSVIQPVVEMHGDFDVTLGFDDLQMPDLYSAAGLGLFIGDKHLELIRRHGEPLIERVHATYVTPAPDGQGRSVADLGFRHRPGLRPRSAVGQGPAARSAPASRR